ncbi:hypothetical protein M0638_01410 [Roseomonas sp. NAR14]|uniref:SRP54-type proteins GTP-binding domain-containing protein n=1 Tax=Roseomonas acroporae TaxID=2937791 RepID=A0A9X1Y4F3_9PROT|nr:hypothetical protein [Roseomonas acroporae]MCK8783038.1 hypothetical protein [Roseomonas acroporae]
MRPKQFQAASMAEAMALVRAEFGADAIILSCERRGDLVELAAAAEPEIEDPAPPSPSAAGRPSAEAVALALRRHNLPAALAAPLAARCAALPLEAGLADSFAFMPLPDGIGRPLLLAGPHGAGKTLSCAKLATRMVLSGVSPLVISADGMRAGGPEQLAAFTRLLGLDLAVVRHRTMLASVLAQRPGGGTPVLIDAAGCDPADPEQAAALRSLVATAGASVLLVLPAGLDPDEAAELGTAFAALGATHLLPTRLDAARRLGGVLAAAAAGGLALTEAGIGPGAAHGLLRLSPAVLAERLLAMPAQGGAGVAPLAPRPAFAAPSVEEQPR